MRQIINLIFLLHNRWTKEELLYIFITRPTPTVAEWINKNKERDGTSLLIIIVLFNDSIKIQDPLTKQQLFFSLQLRHFQISLFLQ